MYREREREAGGEMGSEKREEKGQQPSVSNLTLTSSKVGRRMGLRWR